MPKDAIPRPAVPSPTAAKAVARPTTSEADDPISPFLDYLRENRIVLVKDPEAPHEWKLAGPSPVEGLDVVVHFKTFPPGWTSERMERELLMISLAYVLDAPDRLAMSSPGFRGRPGFLLKRPVPDPMSLPVGKRILQLFELYRGVDGEGLLPEGLSPS